MVCSTHCTRGVVTRGKPDLLLVHCGIRQTSVTGWMRATGVDSEGLP